MEIKYEIKGLTLNENDIMDIHHYYEAARTAEYLMDNYNITDEAKALELGYRVRELMNQYDYDEEEAIEIMMIEKEEMQMAKYRVSFVEKIFYEVYVDADNVDEAEEKAIELFDNGDKRVEVTDQYVDQIDVEEEF